MNQGSISAEAQGLLSLSQTLNKYEELLDRHTGRRFNIFGVVGSCEETHSSLIAELLRPYGTHGHKDVFLKHFIAAVERESPPEVTIPPLEHRDVEVLTEFGIGPVTDEGGGRIDILIRERGEPRFIIENKIYAAEQDNQLGRYEHYAPDAALIFLTLYGDKPKNLKGQRPKNLVCISYKKHVLEWLEACHKEAVDAPNVREVIAQYIRFVKQLTNQAISDYMSQEIITAALASPSSLHAFFSLSEAAPKVRSTLVQQMYEQLDRAAQDLGLKLNKCDKDLAWKRSEFTFDLLGPRFSPFKECRICFGFDSDNYQNFYFGFNDNGAALGPNSERERLYQLFRKHYPKAKSTGVWPAWVRFDDAYVNWSHEVFEKMYSQDCTVPSVFVKDLGRTLEQVKAVAEEFVGPTQVIGS